MDKRVVLAVAGSGKSSLLIGRLDLTQRHLLLTYTQNNVQNLRRKVIEKFGYFPPNIHLSSYYSFLYKFCYRPILYSRIGAKGINHTPNSDRYAKGLVRYVDSSNRLYGNRIAKLLEVEEVLSDISERIGKYFDQIFIDEIQDFGGHDFNLLSTIAKTNTGVLFVGDFFQHTFDTSRDGPVNRTLHNDLAEFVKRLKKLGFDVDLDCLKRSYRCSPTVCEFISQNLGIAIDSHRKDDTEIILVENASDAERVSYNDDVVKLFYESHYKYPCRSKNWGSCKGEDNHGNVCVVLNRTTLNKFRSRDLMNLAPQSRNKLYVALSRTRETLYLMPDKLIRHCKFAT